MEKRTRKKRKKGKDRQTVAMHTLPVETIARKHGGLGIRNSSSYPRRMAMTLKSRAELNNCTFLWTAICPLQEGPFTTHSTFLSVIF